MIKQCIDTLDHKNREHSSAWAL